MSRRPIARVDFATCLVTCCPTVVAVCLIAMLLLVPSTGRAESWPRYQGKLGRVVQQLPWVRLIVPATARVGKPVALSLRNLGKQTLYFKPWCCPIPLRMPNGTLVDTRPVCRYKNLRYHWQTLAPGASKSICTWLGVIGRDRVPPPGTVTIYLQGKLRAGSTTGKLLFDGALSAPIKLVR